MWKRGDLQRSINVSFSAEKPMGYELDCQRPRPNRSADLNYLLRPWTTIGVRLLDRHPVEA
jgi:hypothetical protein